MTHYFKALILGLVSGCLPGLTMAANKPGIGDYADSMMAPVGILSSFVSTGSIIIGIGCIMGALLRYSQHRINPIAAPLSSVIILLILGLLLLGLPFLNNVLGQDLAFLNVS